MKVTVFGGSGFVGSHVADALTNRGHEVTLFDLTESPWLRQEQRMVVGNLLDAEAVADAVRGQDAVYNFAGLGDLDHGTTRARETVEQNVLGTVLLLDACKNAGVGRFVYASTIYVYSDKGGFYRCSKQATELYVEEYQKKYGLDFTIVRYGTLYGPRSDEKNSVYRFIKQAIDSKNIVAQANGNEMREYIHVRDAAALSSKILSPEYRNRHVILTGHHPMMFRQMLEMIAEILGGDVEIRLEQDHGRNHYALTPYSFIPKIGNKLVTNDYVDMGQGLLECIHEYYSKKCGDCVGDVLS